MSGAAHDPPVPQWPLEEVVPVFDGLGNMNREIEVLEHTVYSAIQEVLPITDASGSPMVRLRIRAVAPEAGGVVTTYSFTAVIDGPVVSSSMPVHLPDITPTDIVASLTPTELEMTPVAEGGEPEDSQDGQGYPEVR